MNGKIIVVDFDDVLVNFAHTMYSIIRSNWRVFSRWFSDEGELTVEQLQSRKLFNLNEWMIQSKYKDLTSKEYSALQLIIWKNMKEIIFESEDLYGLLEPTPFARKTIMNSQYINDSLVEKVYILSRNITAKQDLSKKAFIERWFNHPKISYINIEPGESKADAMKKLDINFDVFIDDEIPNIRKVAEEYNDLSKKEFIIPEYGYNKMPAELGLLIEGKGRYYNLLQSI